MKPAALLFPPQKMRRSFCFAPSVLRMSAIGTKRTSLVALHMSAFGCKADIIQEADIKKCPLMTPKRTSDA